MTDKGFIVLDRAMSDWQWWDNMNGLGLWIHILHNANWKDGWFMGNRIPRGSFATSIKNLAEETDLSEKTVRNWLKKFEEAKQIEVKGTNKFTLIKVINYAKYQDVPVEKGEQDTEQDTKQITDQLTEQVTNQVTDNRTNKQSNKETKEQYIQKKNTSSSCSEPLVKVSEPEACVEALVLNDGTEWRPTFRDYEEFKRLYPNVDIDDQFRRMRAWLITNPSRRKTKRGVMQFVNRWLSKAQDKPSQPKAEEKKGFSVF